MITTELNEVETLPFVTALGMELAPADPRFMPISACHRVAITTEV